MEGKTFLSGARTIEELEAIDAAKAGTPPVEPVVPPEPQVTAPTRHDTT